MGGLSVYTCRLANALAEEHDVSVLLLDKLIPQRLYPGGARTGQSLTDLTYRDDIARLGTVDWYWGAGIARAVSELKRVRPELLILQWWTAATLHTYLALALAARRLGIPVVLEFHEIQDPGEADLPGVAAYARRLMPLLLSRVSGALIHNQHDVDQLRQVYGAAAIDRLSIQYAPHGPYDHLTAPAVPPPSAVTRLLFFGLIRPYKGVEDLIRAFDGLTAEEAACHTLTVVGETWENWTLPAELIAASPYRDRITFVNRYVSDAEAAQFIADSDVVVLPYRRGSASGPLQIAMSQGLHVVLYAVGGLVEAVADYEGAQLVTPDDIDQLRRAILDVGPRRAQRFSDPHSWDAIVDAHGRLASRFASA